MESSTITRPERRIHNKELALAPGNGNIGHWEWDFYTDEVFIDEGIEKIFGIEPGTFKGTFVDFEKLFNKADIPLFKKTISSALNEDLPIDTIFRMRTGTDENKYFSIKAIVEKDDSGGLVKMTGICTYTIKINKGVDSRR